MKRFLLSCVFLGAGFCMVVISAIAVAQEQVAGQAHVKDVMASASAQFKPELVYNSEVEDHREPIGLDSSHVLPYPGILPNHPLYLIKMIRDRVNLVITRQPQSRFELLSLYGNKRIRAAEELIQLGEISLGVDTAVKASGYLQQAHQLLDSKADCTALQQDIRAHKQIVTQLLEELGTEQTDRQRLEQVHQAQVELFQTVETIAQSSL